MKVRFYIVSAYILMLSSCAIPVTDSKFIVRGVASSVDVKIAATVRGDKKMEHGIYLYDLNCYDGFCSLESLSLNECYKNDNDITSFSPRSNVWMSSNGFLEAKQLSDTEIEIVIFQAAHGKLPAKITLTFYDEKSPPYFRKLKSFYASGLVDLKAFPYKLSLFDHEAIQGDQLKQLDCPIFLPGISHKSD